MTASPSRTTLRKLLDVVLVTEPDFESFCLDFFSDVHKRFSTGMDRLGKTNLLLELVETERLLEKLRLHAPDAMQRHAAILKEDTSRAVQRRELAQKLESLLDQKEDLLSRQRDCSTVEAQILDVRRQQRQGPQLQEGEILSERYRLRELVGRGGFANVWQAYDRKRQQVLAIKVLHGQWSQDHTVLERFERGARKMAALDHPHIVRVLVEPTEDQGFHYLGMEFLAGGDLGRAMRDGKLGRDEALRVVLEAGTALEFAHEAGLVHRDVKPANILLDAKQRARLTDFDLVLGSDTTGGTRTGALGTFLYAAPEAMEDARKVDRRADVYSLGMTALFVLHGGELPIRVLNDRQGFIDRLDCADAIKTVLRRAIAWDPEERPSTAAEFCAALVEATQPPVAPVPPVASVPSPAPEPGDWLLASKKMPEHYCVASDVAIAPPADYLGIYLEKAAGLDCIFMKVSAFTNIAELIERLYRNYLIGTYDPRTYGDTWILVEEETGRMVIGWDYFRIRSNRYERSVQRWAAATSLGGCDIRAGSSLRIVSASSSAFGIVTTSLVLFMELSRDRSRLVLAEARGSIRRANAADLIPLDTEFDGVFLISSEDSKNNIHHGTVFVENDTPI